MEKKKNVPVLRFPEFSGDWEKKKLGEITTQMQSGVSRKLNDSDIGLPILRSNNIQNEGLDVTDIKYWYLKDDQGVNLENYYLKENDVLVNFINSLAQIGKVALFSDLLNRDTIFTTNLLRLSFKNIVDTRFVFYNFNLKSYKDYIQSITKPAVNQASFTTKEFQNYILDLATLPEQQKISSVLTAVDNKLQTLKKKKTLLEQYKKGMMQKIFSQELRFKDDNGNEFPEWEMKTLGEIAEKKSIKNKSNDVKNVFTNSASVGIVNQRDYFDKDIANQNNLLNYYIVENNDFVYNPRISNLAPVGPIGRNHLDTGVMSPLYSVFKFTQGNLDFFEIFFSTTGWHEYMESIANYGARADRMNITSENFYLMPVPFPCLEEQTKIANFLSAIDDKINLCNAQIEKTEQWKKGLLQKMFV